MRAGAVTDGCPVKKLGFSSFDRERRRSISTSGSYKGEEGALP